MGGQAHTPTWREAFGGEWTHDNTGWIWADSLKGGRCHVADVRGWGYLTAGGSGALGLTGDQGAAIQDQVGRVLAAAPELLEALRLARSELGMIAMHKGLMCPASSEVLAGMAERELSSIDAAIAKATGEGEK